MSLSDMLLDDNIMVFGAPDEETGIAFFISRVQAHPEKRSLSIPKDYRHLEREDLARIIGGIEYTGEQIVFERFDIGKFSLWVEPQRVRAE